MPPQMMIGNRVFFDDDTMPFDTEGSRVHRFLNGVETLEDIKDCFCLFSSLAFLLRDHDLDVHAMRPIMHKYACLHAFCATKFRHLEMDLTQMGLLSHFETCLAIRSRVDRVLYTLQIPQPRFRDDDLQAARWEVKIQDSLYKKKCSRTMMYVSPSGILASFLWTGNTSTLTGDNSDCLHIVQQQVNLDTIEISETTHEISQA